MIRHIVSWKFKEEIVQEERQGKAVKLKNDLEALKNIIPGVIELKVIIEPIAGSTQDLMLNSLFESEEALQNYQVHPEHKKVGAYVGEIACNRVCMDYEEM